MTRHTSITLSNNKINKYNEFNGDGFYGTYSPNMLTLGDLLFHLIKDLKEKFPNEPINEIIRRAHLILNGEYNYPEIHQRNYLDYTEKIHPNKYIFLMGFGSEKIRNIETDIKSSSDYTTIVNNLDKDIFIINFYAVYNTSQSEMQTKKLLNKIKRKINELKKEEDKKKIYQKIEKDEILSYYIHYLPKGKIKRFYFFEEINNKRNNFPFLEKHTLEILNRKGGINWKELSKYGIYDISQISYSYLSHAEFLEIFGNADYKLIGKLMYKNTLNEIYTNFQTKKELNEILIKESWLKKFFNENRKELNIIKRNLNTEELKELSPFDKKIFPLEGFHKILEGIETTTIFKIITDRNFDFDKKELIENHIYNELINKYPEEGCKYTLSQMLNL